MNQIRIHPHPWGLWVDPRMEYQSFSLNPKETRTGGKMTSWGCVSIIRRFPSLHGWCSEANYLNPDFPGTVQNQPTNSPWSCPVSSFLPRGTSLSPCADLMCVHLWYSPMFVQSLFSSLGHSFRVRNSRFEVWNAGRAPASFAPYFPLLTPDRWLSLTCHWLPLSLSQVILNLQLSG